MKKYSLCSLLAFLLLFNVQGLFSQKVNDWVLVLSANDTLYAPGKVELTEATPFEVLLYPGSPDSEIHFIAKNAKMLTRRALGDSGMGPSYKESLDEEKVFRFQGTVPRVDSICLS